MQISVTGLTGIRGRALLESARSRVLRTLSRFAPRVAAADIALSDTNGERGGVDKHCRIMITMPGFEPVVATATNENFLEAISRATIRARRMVLTRLKRTRTRRERLRQKHGHGRTPTDLQPA